MKIIIFLGLGLLLTSCDKKLVDNEQTFLRSYINTYCDGPFRVSGSFGNDNGKPQTMIHLLFTATEPGQLYQSPETSGSEKNAKKFLQAAERNGDRAYNRDIYFLDYVGWERYCAHNFKSVRVVCQNKDWDNTHPAGGLLNDMMCIRVRSCANYVRNGYSGVEVETIDKPLAELFENELTMIVADALIYFDSYPATPGTYEMQVTLVTTQGEEKVATCTFDFN